MKITTQRLKSHGTDLVTFIPYKLLDIKVSSSYRRQNLKVVAATEPQKAV